MKKSRLFLLMIAVLCLIGMVSGVAMATSLTVSTYENVYVGEYSSSDRITESGKAVIVFGELSATPSEQEVYGVIVTYPDGTKEGFEGQNLNGLKYGIALYDLEDGLYTFNTFVADKNGDNVNYADRTDGDSVNVALGGHTVTVSLDGEVKNVQYVVDGADAVLPEAQEGYEILWSNKGKEVHSDLDIQGTTYQIVDKTSLGSIADIDMSLDVANYAFSLADVDSSLTDNSQIVAVSADGIGADFGLSGTDAFTISKAQMNFIDKGERVAKVYMSDGKVYAFTITVITDVIETASEFTALISSVANAPVPNEDDEFPILEGEYYVLGTNITMDTATALPTISWQKAFAGVFDGRGYSLIDVNATSNGGIFRVLRGTFKNVSLINIKASYGLNGQAHNEEAGFICKSLNGGTIENVYIEGIKTMTTWTNTSGGIVYDMYAGTIRNTIQKVTYRYDCSGSPQVAVGSSTIACGIANGEESTVENNIYILDDMGGSMVVSISAVPEHWKNNAIYASEELAVAGQDFASFTAPWIVVEGKLPVLKGNWVETLSGEGYFAVSASGTSKLDFGSTGVDESKVRKVAKLVGGVETELAVSGENGVYLDSQALAIGENTLKVYTGDGTFVIKVIGADTIVANANEMEAFLTAVKNGDSMSGKTIVLSDDVDYQNADITTTAYAYPFRGTLDGRGHVIYNAVISDNRAIFSTFTGTIKNLGIVGARNARYGNENAILVNEMGAGARIENCYVDAKICWAEGNTGGLVYYFAENSTITNCIVNISYYWNGSCTSPVEGKPYTGVIGLLGVTDETFVVTSNCFGITPNELGLYGIEKGGAITNSASGANEEAILSGGTYDFSSFNEFWVVEEGKLPVFKSLAK